MGDMRRGHAGPGARPERNKRGERRISRPRARLKESENIRKIIEDGKTALGIELGSTRIKAVLVDEDSSVLAVGSHNWENRYEDGVWTYTLDDVWTGVQYCYADLAKEVRERYGATITTLGSLGFSAMMHGLLCFDEKGELLSPFRTWRNVMTEKASRDLTALFNFNIPLRWSISHLWEDMLDGKAHVKDVAFFTTLAGYVHWICTGEKVIGIGDASGMFPIDCSTHAYDARMAELFNKNAAEKGYEVNILDLLPAIRLAGENAGMLTEKGARRLDPTGNLKPGIPVCPPEGDAGTGMVATNSVRPRTGNVSAGTSIFAMIVLEKDLKEVHPEIDIVTTPSGDPVAMVHCNTGSSDIDAWVRLIQQGAEMFGGKADLNELYTTLYRAALEADPNCGGLMAYNYYSGEVITDIDGGAPLMYREPDSAFTIPNVMRTLLNSSLGTLQLGMRILAKEGVQVDMISGHGGFFKTPKVGQSIMADALGCAVSCLETAGEGGAWGIAVLANYMMRKNADETLASYLAKHVFAGARATVIEPDPAGSAEFARFMERYELGLSVESAAVTAVQKWHLDK